MKEQFEFNNATCEKNGHVFTEFTNVKKLDIENRPNDRRKLTLKNTLLHDMVKICTDVIGEGNLVHPVIVNGKTEYTSQLDEDMDIRDLQWLTYLNTWETKCDICGYEEEFKEEPKELITEKTKVKKITREF